MKHYEGMSEDQIRILNLEARMHLAESRSCALASLVLRSLKDLGLKKINGVSPDIFVEQEAERILQVTLAGLADHDPVHANKLAAFLADVQKDARKHTP